MPDAPARRPAALPPLVDPAKWETFPTFRETLLLLYTDPDYNAALRGVGIMLHEVALEAGRTPIFPRLPGPMIRHELAAVAADLRHLEGFLRMVIGADYDRRDEPEEYALAAHAFRLVSRIAKMAEGLEALVRER